LSEEEFGEHLGGVGREAKNKSDAPDKSQRRDREEPGRLRVAAHNLGEPMAVRPRVWCCYIPALDAGILLDFVSKRSRLKWFG
jgi:hypothetical protein